MKEDFNYISLDAVAIRAHCPSFKMNENVGGNERVNGCKNCGHFVITLEFSFGCIHPLILVGRFKTN